mmetsp:Transcript_3016/g.6842  ORF Transcript_3016/g.6842 Transcript_3016/m.6842 type:complete len:166 (+) Transcript_3016:242-739(+)
MLGGMLGKGEAAAANGKPQAPPPRGPFCGENAGGGGSREGEAAPPFAPLVEAVAGGCRAEERHATPPSIDESSSPLERCLFELSQLCRRGELSRAEKLERREAAVKLFGPVKPAGSTYRPGRGAPALDLGLASKKPGLTSNSDEHSEYPPPSSSRAATRSRCSRV